MRTYERIVIKDWEITSKIGQHVKLKRGEKYITSEEENGFCTVFTNYWVKVPIEHFAGEVVFTQR